MKRTQFGLKKQLLARLNSRASQKSLVKAFSRAYGASKEKKVLFHAGWCSPYMKVSQEAHK
ncbi:MAG: hypothetical protein NVSMB27_27650 [Ktedonobacteraceae bacterium]